MRNTETGEYELVMGNRQLLSGFFIVALLFGVAFAMGYIVGRNSSPATKAPSAGAGQAGPVIEQRPPASTPVAPPPAAEPPRTEPAPADSGTRPAETTPAAAAPPPAENPVAPARAATPAASASEPPSGTYWQVIAAKQPEAESVQRALREKGFTAYLTPGPNELIRVIIGPFADREGLGKAKADLENSGFHPHLVKR